MSNAATTFAKYRNDAIEKEIESLDNDGMDAEVIYWMMANEDLQFALRDTIDGFAHAVLTARGENARVEAIDRYRQSMIKRIEQYVDSWDATRQSEFMAEVDEAYAEAKRLDRAEGIES